VKKLLGFYLKFFFRKFFFGNFSVSVFILVLVFSIRFGIWDVFFSSPWFFFSPFGAKNSSLCEWRLFLPLFWDFFHTRKSDAGGGGVWSDILVSLSLLLLMSVDSKSGAGFGAVLEERRLIT
jgi:hypothetical protein